MPTIELWLFTVTDPLTGKRRKTTYRMTMDEAKARYADPVPVEGSLEVRRVDENGSRARARNRCTYVSPARLAAACR